MEFKGKISKTQYFALKSKLKAYAFATTAIRKAANENKADVRYNLRNLKRDMGQDARSYQVAIAFLRGQPYSKVEPNVQSPISRTHLENLLKCNLNYKYIRDELQNDLDKFFNEEVLEEQSCSKEQSYTSLPEEISTQDIKQPKVSMRLGNFLKSILS